MGHTETVRENYQRLRQAGIAPDEARKLRSKGPEVVEQAIRAAQGVPEVQESVSIKPMNKGNPAVRLSEGERALIEVCRQADLGPATIFTILEQEIEKWVEGWQVQGNAVMVQICREKLEKIRGAGGKKWN